MSKQRKKTIKTLSVVTKQRAMELEISKINAARARTLKSDAESQLQKVKLDVNTLEDSLRNSLSSSCTFNVQDIILQKGYIEEKKHELEKVKNNYLMAEKYCEKLTEEVKNNNQKLELITRLKDTKEEAMKKISQRQENIKLDEINVQKSGVK